MNNYICKYTDCNEKYMVMGYCNEHWKVAKATWMPAEMGN